jgi:signal transduction histidine kinase
MDAILSPQLAGIVMLIGGLIPGYIVYWLRTEPQGIIVRWFRFAMLCGAVWSISFGLMVLVESSVLRLAITNIFIVAVPSASIALFALSYEFTFREPISKQYLLLFVPVVLLFVLAWFNPSQLIYTVENPYQTSEILVPANPGSLRLPLNMIGGPVLSLMAAGLVAGELVRAEHKQRTIQAGLLLLMITLGFIPGMMKVLELVPPYFDPTPIGWSLNGVILAVTIKRFDLFRLSPSSKRRVFETLTDPVIALSPENAVSDLNEAARTTFDITLGMTLTELQASNPALQAVLNGSATEVDIEHGDTKRVFGFSEISVPQGYGLESQILLFRDITEQSAKADALRKKTDRLDSFASRVSHDLQSPITVAGSHVNIARRADDPEESLDEIETALQRAENLIDDMLSMARNGEDFDPEPVELGNQAVQAWSTVSTADASLVIETDAIVTADKRQLRRLFENLFRNSIEHGGSAVTVRVETTSEGFYIADNGVGIPASDREKIFDDGVTYDSDGTGYGLAIVRSIVESRGWSIEATASESGGARFDITNVSFDSTAQ